MISVFNRRAGFRNFGSVVFAVLAALVFTTFFMTGNVIRSKRHSDAEAIMNGEYVEAGSEISYRLDSGKNIVDRLPEGLEFARFEGDDGCLDNLNYDLASHSVRGHIDCESGASIVMNVPEIEGGKRMDFYNVVSYDGNYSNRTHYYTGEESVAQYMVIYQYTGDVPSGAPELPEMMLYSNNSVVGLLQDAELEGYEFSGWITSDVEVVDSKFAMPAQTVVFSGLFTPKIEY